MSTEFPTYDSLRQITDALIIRETNTVGESDRFVTALTRELGVIRAGARGARRVKSSRGAATQLLSYSRLSLYRGRSGYIIESAEPLRVFFELRSSLESTALAQYFCELSGVLFPPEEPVPDALRLLLNALHLLGKDTYPRRQIKAVTELRLLAEAGFMPDCVGCTDCGHDIRAGWLYPRQGVVRCERCHWLSVEGPALPLSAGSLAAMRYALQAPPEKCFSFSLSDKVCREWSEACEALVLAQTSREYRTLNFYHSVEEDDPEEDRS